MVLEQVRALEVPETHLPVLSAPEEEGAGRVDRCCCSQYAED